MKRIALLFSALFLVLTFLGTMYVLNGGRTVVYAVVPAVFSIACSCFYQKCSG